jgi:predicted TPR repeat methyltransferase
MSNYRHYSKVYDEVEDKPERSLNFIRKSIKKHNPNAKELLELGCGTGNVIEELEEFSVWGLELSKEMVLPADEVREMLRRHFEIVEVLDGNLKKLSDESRRNFYVCRKK